jgi:hypothetical protein
VLLPGIGGVMSGYRVGHDASGMAASAVRTWR